MIGFKEVLVIAVIVIVLFGRGRISGMMGDVAQGIKAFKKGMSDDDKPAAQIESTNSAPVIEAEKQADKQAS